MKRMKKVPLTALLVRIKSYFDLLKKSTDSYLFVTDLKGQTVLLSSNLVMDFALPGEVLTNMDALWIPLIHPEDRQAYQESMKQLVSQDLPDSHDLEYRVKTRRGDYCWIHCRGRISRNSLGEPELFAGMMLRMAQRNQADSLTGLLNKYQFEHGVKQALNSYRLNRQGGAMMVFGLDNFKIINETYNRSFGDRVLQYVAKQIKNILPPLFMLYKLDGDEFGIVYPGATVNDVEALFADVQKCMMRPNTVDEKMFFCTISAGTVFYPQAGKDYLILHKHAEAALDLAKSSGKNKNCIFTKDQYNRWVRSIAMRDSLKTSVENDCDGFTLFYQPQVDARDQHLIGAEALLRWKNPKGHMVAPMEFIPILEETKMIILVGKWVFEQAVCTCKKWQQKVPNFRMSINVSYEQIKDMSFKEFVRDCVQRYEIAPETIVLELTESCIVADWGFLNKQFDAFRSLGIRIAMDDFGTGYSSLGYLKNLSCDIVKIDREFVKQILLNDFDRRLVEYTVELCHSVGLRVCIEGVEEDEVYRLLSNQAKVDSVQGYLFGHPESEEVFLQKFMPENCGVMILPELEESEKFFKKRPKRMQENSLRETKK